jgi:hypothetical protein
MTNTIHYLTQEELKELLAKVASKRDKALYITHLLLRPERAEIPKEKRHFHYLKHPIAIHLLDAGADIMFVKDWLGYKKRREHDCLFPTDLKDSRRASQEVFSSPKIIG